MAVSNSLYNQTYDTSFEKEIMLNQKNKNFF